jgi:ABC-type transport system substrate-binding protein
MTAANSPQTTWSGTTRTAPTKARIAQQLAYSRTWLTNVKSVSKLDDYTVAFETNFVEPFPYSLAHATWSAGAGRKS